MASGFPLEGWKNRRKIAGKEIKFKTRKGRKRRNFKREKKDKKKEEYVGKGVANVKRGEQK